MSSNNTKNDIKESVSALQAYAALNQKREEEKEYKQSMLIMDSNDMDESNDKVDEGPKNVQDVYDIWKDTLVHLTGDDLLFSDELDNKKKKKYKSWILDDKNDPDILVPKKKKKENFNKKFEPVLNTMQNLLIDQNRFTNDLAKRYLTMAGPATKNGQPLTKNLIELAAVINTARNNSLGLLNAIGSTHSKIADLYMKQRKEDREESGLNSNSSSEDIGLMGSDIVRSLFGDTTTNQSTGMSPADVPANNMIVSNQDNTTPVMATNVRIAKFDPSSWNPGGQGIDVGAAAFETIPHTVYVEYDQANDTRKYIALRNDNKEELVGCPLPVSPIKSVNLDSSTAVDEFDQVYQLILK